MQDGRTIYYNGNTVTRSISKPSQRKRVEMTEVITPQLIRIPMFDKIFATNQCIWCNKKFEFYQMTCQFCHNCQWCGMVAFNNEQCQNCGNHVDDELKREFVERETINF